MDRSLDGGLQVSENASTPWNIGDDDAENAKNAEPALHTGVVISCGEEGKDTVHLDEAVMVNSSA